MRRPDWPAPIRVGRILQKRSSTAETALPANTLRERQPRSTRTTTAARTRDTRHAPIRLFAPRAAWMFAAGTRALHAVAAAAGPRPGPSRQPARPRRLAQACCRRPPCSVRWLCSSPARLSERPATGGGSDVDEAVAGRSSTELRDTASLVSSVPVGRGRLSRFRSSVGGSGGGGSGLPPVTLPDWFLQDRVRLYQPQRPLPTTAYRDDLEVVRDLMFLPVPSSTIAAATARATTVEAPHSPTDLDAAEDQAQIEQYFDTWLRCTEWTNDTVDEAKAHLRERGYGSGYGNAMDSKIERTGAAVAAAATYLLATIASWGGLRPVPAQVSTEGQDSEEGKDSIDIDTRDGSEEPAEPVNAAEPSKLADAPEVATAPPPPPLLAPADLASLDPYGALDLPGNPLGPAAQHHILDLLRPQNRSSFRVVHRRMETLVHDTAAEADGRIDVDKVLYVFGELRATVATELRAQPRPRAASAATASAREVRRPVTVLTLVNHRGHSKAMAVVDNIADALGTDVVHLDARALAAVVAPYLGQTLYAARGNLALLGYAVAHINGQMAPRYARHAKNRGDDDDGMLFKEEEEEDDDEDNGEEQEDAEEEEEEEDDDDEDHGRNAVSSMLSGFPLALFRPPSSSGATLPRLSLQPYPSEMDDRWDDLKISRALEAMVRAADTKAEAVEAASSSSPTTAPQRRAVAPWWSSAAQTPLIVHIHHFLELSTLPEGARLIAKLRAIVDRLWQQGGGRPIVLVGSSAAHMHADAAHALVHKAEQLRQEDDCHIVPYRVDQAQGRPMRALERRDLLATNLANIADMVAALTAGRPSVQAPQLDQPWMQSLLESVGSGGSESNDVREALSEHVYDIHWVYRFSALLLGGRTGTGTAGAAWAAEDAWPHTNNNQAIVLGARAFSHAIGDMRDQNLKWQYLAGAQEPYFSPLTTIRDHHKTWTKNRDDDDDEGSSKNGPFIKVTVNGIRGRMRRSPSPSPSSPPSSSSSAKSSSSASSSSSPSPPIKYTDLEKKFLSGLIDGQTIRTTFDDIVLPQETKDSLRALTSLSLERPDAFQYGVLATERIPGCLLYGPPGTGKTLLAKAVAKQSGASMLEVSAASINDMWVGSSERNVQALFALARKRAPVVLFLDEADALLGARETRPGGGGGSRRETINQFLREWDGVAGGADQATNAVFVMVATNRPFDLDDAVLRRLPRRILVDLPRADARLAILRRLLRDELLDPPAATALARIAATDTELYSGSDLKNLCVAAAMEAVRDEVRQQATHTGPEPFSFPPRRVLRAEHFERALQAIGASISEDMASLRAIRRFDERYGDNTMASGVNSDGTPRRRRRKKRGMGFEVAPPGAVTEDALVRQAA